jgi:Tfp pilus assembly protein PilV
MTALLIQPSPRHAGFSYVGVLLAAVLLAVCALPAADAVRNALAAPQAGANRLRSLLCLKSQMETVIAQPYQNLLGAAAGANVASAYSLAADAGCPARNVYISKVSVDAEGITSYPAFDTGLLQVAVSLPGADPAAAPLMSLATVVTR